MHCSEAQEWWIHRRARLPASTVANTWQQELRNYYSRSKEGN